MHTQTEQHELVETEGLPYPLPLDCQRRCFLSVTPPSIIRAGHGARAMLGFKRSFKKQQTKRGDTDCQRRPFELGGRGCHIPSVSTGSLKKNGSCKCWASTAGEFAGSQCSTPPTVGGGLAAAVGVSSRRWRPSAAVGRGIRRRRSASAVGVGGRRRRSAPVVGGGGRRRLPAARVTCSTLLSYMLDNVELHACLTVLSCMLAHIDSAPWQFWLDNVRPPRSGWRARKPTCHRRNVSALTTRTRRRRLAPPHPHGFPSELPATSPTVGIP